MQGKSAQQKALAYGVMALLFLFICSEVPFVRGTAGVIHEDAMLALNPSAERAYRYATKHFDATHPDLYDIARAKELYEKANELNSQLPYLQHQRARIAFLQGDLSTALARIDEEIETNPSSLSSYYVRGLIKGFAKDYAGAAGDYETYLRGDPTNWAAINDYAWVLLKADRPLDALVALDWGLQYWPENPWLLNSKATAHFELGQLVLAEDTAKKAAEYVDGITEADWLQAYPGNDPLIAGEGLVALKKAVQENIHTIVLARESSAQDVQ